MGSKSVGYILVGLGIIFLVDRLIPSNVNLLAIFFSLALIFVGYSLLQKKGKHVFNAFSSGTQVVQNHSSSYSTIFAEQKLDFCQVDNSTNNYKVFTLFAETRILIPTDMPIYVHASTYFGECNFPDSNSESFGSSNFIQNTDNPKKAVVIEVTTLFGESSFYKV